MIKLSELHEQRKSFDPSSDDDYFVFDVQVDEELFAPPPNVREIGILATTTKGMVDDVVMDVLIAYHLAGLDTILEFPHEVDFFDARHLVQTAAQSNASLSFVPPSDLTDESFEAYCLKLEAVAKAYMGQQAMTRFVMPVTNYLQHMFLEVIDPEKAKSFVPEDSVRPRPLPQRHAPRAFRRAQSACPRRHRRGGGRRGRVPGIRAGRHRGHRRIRGDEPRRDP
ncbi:hypothetical protein [Rhizobium leguminosarum]|uniref:hypothetical protein n=1 Tax=Rhizobium leguminosarum TaxID=384 RepID=UPI002E14A05B|nr:hypothetical protein U8Q02_44135 [Rhizobium leguminosarum]